MSQKRCGRCGKPVDPHYRAGMSCPYCAARWSYEKGLASTPTRPAGFIEKFFLIAVGLAILIWILIYAGVL